MNIITGYTGQNHIEAGDVQGLIKGIVGNGLTVCNTGMQFEPEILDANTVRINSGDAIFQGVHCRIPYGESDTVEIANGSPDFDRIDVIALRYEKDFETGEESVSWAYYQGESDGEEPAITEGIIEEGALVAEGYMFRIAFDRMTPHINLIPSATDNLEEAVSKSRQASKLLAYKANESDTVYKPGDTDTLYFEPVCGEVYSNKKTLRFFVPFQRSLKGVTKVTIIEGTYQVKANNTVIVSESSLAGATVTAALRPNGITVTITKTSGFSGYANAVCAVTGSMKVRFSA